MMELPQSRAAFGGEGRKPTHDFLSLCSHSNLHQDPRPSSQGNLLQTHDFLGKTSGKEETSKETTSGEKPQPQAPPPLVEHLLPGGIGTYSISHISYYSNLGGPVKPEAVVGFTAAQSSSNTERNDENSNSSSYANSGFTLWEESAAKKGKTGKENSHAVAVKESVVKLGQWTSTERPSISSSNNNHRSSFSPFSSSQPVGQKNQSFINMFKSAKGASSQEEELDDEDEFMIKKENSPVPKGGDLRVKVDGKSGDQKANTPRSKHSATEQRRRSKINDRFQALRTLIPQSDQKRDKASFLLEVIEYIQFLQEKVHKFEGTYQGFNYDQAKMMSLRNGQRPPTTEAYADQSRGGTAPGLVLPTKFEENNVSISPAILENNQEVPFPFPVSVEENNVSIASGVTANKPVPVPVPLQQNMATPPVRGLGISQRPDLEVKAPQSSSLTDQTKSWPNDGASSLNDKLEEQELDVEGGTISISSAYSKGLLNTLTQALQSSGVDLSGANISVQIELAKRANGKSAMPSSTRMQDGGGAGTTRPRVEGNNSAHYMHQALKKMKTGKS